MLPLSAVADNKSKAATQEECVELAKILYGEVILKYLNPSERDVFPYLYHVLNSQRSSWNGFYYELNTKYISLYFR